LKIGQLIAAVFFGALTQAASVALAGASAWLIVRASQMPPVLSLNVAVVGVRAFGITRGVSRYIERLTAHRVALSGMTNLRVRLYERMAAGSGAGAAAFKRGDVLARVGADIDDVGDLVVRGMIPALVAAVLVIGSSVTIGLFLPAAGLAVFVCLTLVAVGGPLLTFRAARISE
jgi:ABC-type transport system involved in cytochrome bd biosynthesis fused ATPase/permease subunit